MKASIFVLLTCLLFTGSLHAQQDSPFHFQRSYREQITDFTVDNIGNVYLLFQNGQLKKMQANGDSVAVFNNVRRFGKPYSIDAGNPLKVLLYFRDFGTIVILDRLLNNRSVIDLRSQHLLQVNAIGQSYDNNIWIFDGLENKLRKIGDDGKLMDQSADLRMVFDSTPSPQIILDQDQAVYLYDTLKGVYVFDYYGGFKTRLPFTGWTDFRVINKSFFGRDGKFLYRYDPGNLNLQQMPIPQYMSGAQKIIVVPGTIYVLKDGELRIYSWS
jgi:hypothetical protein